MLTPKISLILAIYNQEEYLERCLISILKSTLRDFEVILVDDGSTDKSRLICNKYCESDNRFKYFYKTNGGVASARQLGLEKALGDYFIFVDPDDWVEEDFLSVLYDCASKNSAEMVICDYTEEYGDTIRIVTHNHIIDKSIADLKLALCQGLFWGVCWNKLIKRSVAQFRVNFESDINYQEDKLFIYRVLGHVQRISFVNASLYHYNRCNTTSALSTYNIERFTDAWRVRNKILEEEHDKSFKRNLAGGLVSLYNVLDLYYIRNLGDAEYNSLIKAFKPIIRLKCFQRGNYNLATRILVFAASFRFVKLLFNVLHNKKSI